MRRSLYTAADFKILTCQLEFDITNGVAKFRPDTKGV